MKFQRLYAYLFAMLLLVSVTGCGKDDDDNEPSQRDLLTAGQWTGEAIWAFGQDVSNEFRESFGYDIKKNIMKFDKAGTFTDNYERTTVNGKWEFANNEQSIVFDKGTDDEYTVKILKLTATELHYEQTIEFEDDDPLVLELRYKR